MQNRALTPALWAAALFATTACIQHETETAPAVNESAIHCDATSGTCFRVDARGPSCGARTWVGRIEGSSCPAGSVGRDGRWALRDANANTQNSQLCRYEWKGTADSMPDAEALASLGANPTVQRLAPDCEIVAASAQAIEVTWPGLERAFYKQIERLAVLPEGQHPGAPVRVEIIDSAVTRRTPDGEPSFGRLPHGRAMGQIVRKLACPSPDTSCRADVASTLALPLVVTPAGVARDADSGGYFGSLGDLASAIEEAVEDWQTHARDHRLVINLSLGWERSHGGDYVTSPNELEAPVRAVWDAIARARCLGAAIIVATGNRTEGPDAVDGPLYPAGWATKPTPTESVCASLGVEPEPGYAAGEPLVFAAGGVESNDADLGLSRKNARPELVAPAAHAVVAAIEGHSTLQTGTSVAAAVTSAVAAVVWSYRPELSADEVIEFVYEGGADLGRPADVCMGQGPCERTAHRVSMCGAVEAACDSGAARCPSSVPSCAHKPAGRIARPEYVELQTAYVVSADDMVRVGDVGWPCHGELFAPLGSEVQNPCPASQLFGAAPLAAVAPQPRGDPICPHCAYSESQQELFIEIESWVSGDVTNPVLAVVVDPYSEVLYFDLSDAVPLLTAGEQATVSGLDVGTQFESMTIEFIVDGAESQVSPVMQW